MNMLRFAGALLALALCACASTPRLAPEYNDDLSLLDVETDPRWLGQLYAEGDLSPQSVESADGGWSAALPAAEPPRVEQGEVLVPLGGEAGVARCLVAQPTAQVANGVKRLMDPILAQGGKAEVKYAAARPGPVPVLAAHAMISGGPAAGNYITVSYLKVVAAVGPFGAVVCDHHRFGYRETLEAVATGFARTLKWASPGAPAAQVELVTEPAPGLVRSRIRHPDGRVWVQTSRLLPAGRSKLSAVDTGAWYDADGHLEACVKMVDGAKQERSGDSAASLGCDSVVPASQVTPR